MHATQDKTVGKTVIVFFLQIVKGEKWFRIVPKVVQLCVEAIIVKFQQILKMTFALMRWSARAKEVRKFNSGSSQASVLKIQNCNVCWIGAAFSWISESNNIDSKTLCSFMVMIKLDWIWNLGFKLKLLNKISS